MAAAPAADLEDVLEQHPILGNLGRAGLSAALKGGCFQQMTALRRLIDTLTTKFPDLADSKPEGDAMFDGKAMVSFFLRVADHHDAMKYLLGLVKSGIQFSAQYLQVAPTHHPHQTSLKPFVSGALDLGPPT